MANALFDPAAPPRRVLAICTRRLGDVLLTTALLRSLRRAWPGAELDVLTLQGSAAALEGNPDVTRVIPLAEAAGVGESLRAIGGLRRYDLALSTLYSDRAHLTAFAAAGRRAGVLAGAGMSGSGWKRLLATVAVDLEGAAGRYHTVVQYLRLADALGIPRHADLVPPRAPVAAGAPIDGPYAVLHPAALFRYKGWTLEGWRVVLRWLAAQGVKVVLDAGPGEAERQYLDALVEGCALPAGALLRPALLRFAQLTPLLEGARAYLGPDTGVTHLAAATGVPTVALFGPMSPFTWGPWPRGGTSEARSPWRQQAPLQQCGNVWLLQGITPCVPCELAGCERHATSRADCLDQLPPSRVIAALDAALRQNARHGHPA